MDPASRTPEPRERAVSSEPCSTRPNPFDDSGISRKRRRTSLSGSRSLSLGSTQSDQDDHPSSTTLDHPSHDADVSMDTDPATPQTPDGQGASNVGQPAEPPSSRVTINIRQPNPSSPASPTPLPDMQTVDDVKLSVEGSEADIGQPRREAPDEAPDTPVSSPSDTGSPDIEVIDVQPDNDGLSAVDPDVSVVAGRTMTLDPTAEFPYNDGEPLADTATRLSNYVNSQTQIEDNLFSQIRDWIDSYTTWGLSTNYRTLYDSYMQNLSFWQAFPEFFWATFSKSAIRGAVSRQAVYNVHISLANLTSLFVVMDCTTLARAQKTRALENCRVPETASYNFLGCLHHVIRRDEPRILNGTDGQPAWGADRIGEMALKYASMRGGELGVLTRLAKGHIDLMERFPRLIDQISAGCQVVADIIFAYYRRYRYAGYGADHLAAAKQRFIEGHRYYSMVSDVLTQAIDKYINNLTTDGVSAQITSLTDIYQCCLHADHKQAKEEVASHHHMYPNLRIQWTPDAIAWEWRFDMFGKLIMSSQMQLRVWAVGHMCGDLVAFWKRCGEPHDDLHPFLAHFAQYLLRTRLVEYILGPTCHPEITLESGNVVGFLLVTKFYQKEQTDLLWQTITSSQDRRVTDALTRMTANITNLCDHENLLYLCEKLQTLPIEIFNTSAMRYLCEQVLKFLMAKCQGERRTLDLLPYELCLRLLRESSVPSSQSRVAYPDLQAFATQRLRDLHQFGPDRDNRRRFYLACLEDVAVKTPTALGSLYALFISIRNVMAQELRVLTSEHELTRLIVEELEHAIDTSRSGNGMQVLAAATNLPRREFITNIICYEPATLTPDLGQRLWDLMVGPRALCNDDRVAAWEVLNNAGSNTEFQNSFILMCLVDYFPSLPPECFCQGALCFVKEGVVPRVNKNEIALDRDESVRMSGIEQLWRMILTVPHPTVADAAIDALVRDIYIESAAILDYPHHRARQAHLGLVNRCLEQLGSATEKLKSFSEGTASGDDESMVIVATDNQMVEQERIFVRSLAVLRQFLHAHQSKSHFATADLRSLMPPSPPATVEGESAELKYQSFDGDTQTEVQPLVIGRQNTAASLLAAISATTGFENYRIYYRGQAFLPNETEICRSLEDLHIHNGLILVKREETRPSPSSWIRPGTSPLEIEILSHFQGLWRYLSMEEKFAYEIYQFLIKLPADPQALEAFDSDSTSYLEVFPLGQPFKCLYAIYALGEYTDACRRRRTTWPNRADAEGLYQEAMKKALSFIFSAISDPDVIERCPSEHLRLQLSLQLMTSLVDFLKAWRLSVVAEAEAEAAVATAETAGATADWTAPVPPLSRLTSILTTAKSTQDENSFRLISATFSAIMQLCGLSDAFWAEFTSDEAFGSLTQDLLVDYRHEVRERVAKIIDSYCQDDQPLDIKLAEFFWPHITAIIPRSHNHRERCHEAFTLTEHLMLKLLPAMSPVLDLMHLAGQCCQLLRSIRTTEDIGDADPNDVVVGGLVKIFNCCLELNPAVTDPENEAFRRGDGSKLFWKHLFLEHHKAFVPGQRVVLNRETRLKLYNIVFQLSTADGSFETLLDELKELVPFEFDEEDPYYYDLPPQFERAKAIRSTCGYVGLRNLSNTCYLNSLFTQLFMNVDFRRFILSASVRDGNNQKLLFQTQKLFSYMQESVKRYVDPQLCVAAIKTYDDTPIDVHNQMDVDEFYNLLFDRWESQLLTADERRTLRSFYGGQLVQQVKSNECEHVSERLEPFSAIQCDIKGKSDLQDSLQAYVDGEIMEGDNKYKCSTCDKHVDAVKRACLKDVPDNLIFHLKRFDFNLRTMQRSKINDYFSFPKRIDMRPYTIDHLTTPDESGPEDMFELVGILVHAGTAESGHYYSYIRERPSSSDEGMWIEFNDDLVSPWDSRTMDTSTYGGAEPRFDSNGAFDKSYSAYMLFYQRSSTLRQTMEGIPMPLKVPVPEDLDEHIQRENSCLIQRHCIFDPGHAPFIQRVFAHAVNMHGKECPRVYKVEKKAMMVALGHLDQVVSRTKDVPDFPEFFDKLQRAIARCSGCATAFFRYFYYRVEAFRALVQRNPEQPVRFHCGNLLILALSKLKQDEPDRYRPEWHDGYYLDRDCILAQVVPLFVTLWNHFQLHLRSWNEVFGLLLRFGQLGDLETAMLLGHDFLVNCLRIIQADGQLELAPNFHRMLTNVLRRAPNRGPSYEAIIILIDHMMARLGPIEMGNTTERGRDRLLKFMQAENSGARVGLPWTNEEVSVLHMEWPASHGSSIFVSKLFDMNQALAATSNIVRRLILANAQMDFKVYNTLRVNITGQHIHSHTNAPFLRGAFVYCKWGKDGDRKTKLLEHVANQTRQLANQEGRSFLTFHRELYQVPAVADDGDLFLSQMGLLPRWAPSLLGNYDPEVRYQTEEFVQKAVFSHGVSPVFADEEGGEKRRELVITAARELGFNCLLHMRDHYVQRRMQVARDVVSPLLRVVHKAAAYFNPEPEDQGPDSDFLRLSTAILDSVRRITVDELEEEGSEWDNSGGSSAGELETFESLGDTDLQTDLH